MAKEQQIIEDFEAFEKGIHRLQELEQELSKIDTNGFESDVNRIKSKLKDVSAVSFVEKQLELLKKKVAQQTAITKHSAEIDGHAQHAIQSSVSHISAQAGHFSFKGLLSKEAEGIINAEISKKISLISNDARKQLDAEKQRLEVSQKQKLAELEKSLRAKYASQLNQELKSKDSLLSQEYAKRLSEEKKIFEQKKTALEKELDVKLNARISEIEKQRAKTVEEVKLKSTRLQDVEKQRWQLVNDIKSRKTVIENNLLREKEALQKKYATLVKQKNDEISAHKKQLDEAFNELLAVKLQQKINADFNKLVKENRGQIREGLLKKFAQKQNAFEDETRKVMSSKYAAEFAEQRLLQEKLLKQQKQSLEGKYLQEIERQKASQEEFKKARQMLATEYAKRIEEYKQSSSKEFDARLEKQKDVLAKRNLAELRVEKEKIKEDIEKNNNVFLRQQSALFEHLKQRELEKFKNDLLLKHHKSIAENTRLFEQKCEAKITAEKERLQLKNKEYVIEKESEFADAKKKIGSEFKSMVASEMQTLQERNKEYLAKKTSEIEETKNMLNKKFVELSKKNDEHFALKIKEVEQQKKLLEKNFEERIKTELDKKVKNEFGALLTVEKKNAVQEVTQNLKDENNATLSALKIALTKKLEQQNTRRMVFETKKLAENAERMLQKRRTDLEQEYAAKQAVALEEKKALIKKQLENSIKKLF